jgi:asparagine synthase (glutamine-hydrolysing)
MCGIVGVVHANGGMVETRALARMRDTIRHRGPDDEGMHVSGSVGFGSRRLAIIDLSSRAKQPMRNEAGDVWLVFNGEIYNFRELRLFLERKGHRFVSDGDSEVVVHLYEEFGLDCVQALRGMFAFAIWDEKKRRLFLGRDRVGKKPLYYAILSDGIAFASEIKALLCYPGVPKRIDPCVLHYYLALQYIPSPHTAFGGISRLPAAHVLTWCDGDLQIERYWRLNYTEKAELSEEKASALLWERLDEAVRIRLCADVPIGIHLSGGVDSAAVAAFVCQALGSGVKSFSIGFNEREYDERQYARLVAKRLGTEHYEYVIGPDAVKELPRLLWHYDQPFADPSALPTFVLSRLTREHVTVALNGDGGDENFAGYDRYRERLLFAIFDHLPDVVRRGMLARAFGTPRRSTDGGVFSRLRRFMFYASESRERRYCRTMCHFTPEQLAELYTDNFWALIGSRDPFEPILDLFERVDGESFLERLLAVDTLSYLPDDLLVKVDVASMAHSLEVRSPFLDHTFMEFSAGLPDRYKLRGASSKYLLKKALRGRLPAEIIDRPKTGFGIPLAQWLRHDLREMIYEVLLDMSVGRRGYFRLEAVERLLDEHTSGGKNWGTQIWNLLMLELTFRRLTDEGITLPDVHVN